MICEYCHGAGKIKTIKLISAEQGFDCVEEVCTKCNGSGEKEQINEEWFSGLSAEDKADFLAGIADPPCVVCEAETCGEVCVYQGEIDTVKKLFLKWLKEKHE